MSARRKKGLPDDPLDYGTRLAIGEAALVSPEESPVTVRFLGGTSHCSCSTFAGHGKCEHFSIESLTALERSCKREFGADPGVHCRIYAGEIPDDPGGED